MHRCVEMGGEKLCQQDHKTGPLHGHTSSLQRQSSLQREKMLPGKIVTIVMNSPGVFEGWITKLSNKCVGVYF